MEEFDIRYKNLLLSTFKQLTIFLEKNNIKWWAAYGTMLGAVRHHSIIPWDDDVDIYLLREDVKKLVSLREELKRNNLDILSTDTDIKYARPFIKVFDTKSTVWEKRHIPVLHGVWVDIFILDYTSDSKDQCSSLYEEYYSKFRKYENAIIPIPIKSIAYSLLKGDFNRAWVKLVNKVYLYHFANRFFLKWKEYDNSIQKTSGTWLICYTGGYGAQKELFKKEWFSDTIKCKFADFEVNIPIGYDMYLTQLYGDYMTPPNPIPDYSHSMYYTNLEESLSKSDVENEINTKRYMVKPFVRYRSNESLTKFIIGLFNSF